MNRKRFIAAGALALFGLARGRLPEFPPAPAAPFALMPEGNFLFLDGGTLELGIFRDSTLDATNDFQIFGETFENVAHWGKENLYTITTAAE